MRNKVFLFQVQEVENCIYYVIEGMKNETKINALYRRVSKYYFRVCCYFSKSVLQRYQRNILSIICKLFDATLQCLDQKRNRKLLIVLNEIEKFVAQYSCLQTPVNFTPNEKSNVYDFRWCCCVHCIIFYANMNIVFKFNVMISPFSLKYKSQIISMFLLQLLVSP